MYELLFEVFPWIVGLYLADALVYVRPHQAALARVAGGFRLRGPGLYLVGLAPVSEALLAEELPVLLGPDAVYRPHPGSELPAVPGPEDMERIPYEDLADSRAEDRTVRAGGRALATAATAGGAERLAEGLRRLCTAAPERRAQELRAILAEEHSWEGVRELRARQARDGRLRRALGWVIGVGVFAVLPLGVYTPLRERLDLRVIALVLALAYAALLAVSARSLRDCGVERRLSTLAGLLFFPPAAAHAGSVLFRDLYRSFAPLAVAAELLPPKAFRRAAGRELEALQRAAARAEGGLKEAWMARRQAVLDLLTGRGASLAELEAPLRPDDLDARAYCPLCGAGYREGFTSCSDCGTTLLAVER